MRKKLHLKKKGLYETNSVRYNKLPESHDGNRKLVFIICMGKAERLLSKNLNHMINIEVFSGFLENEHILPLGISGNCCLVIQSLTNS